MFSRRTNVEVFPVYYAKSGNGTYEVQTARQDYRPAQRHYGYRFDTVKATRCRAKAERIALHMRTDGRKVRVAFK